MTSSGAFELAKRKARYSDYDWVVWKGRDGQFNAERSSYDAIKKALLAVGTQGHFNLIQSRTAWSHIMRWRTGINAMQYMRHYQRNAEDFMRAATLIGQRSNQ